jgi:hypothetical protein
MAWRGTRIVHAVVVLVNVTQLRRDSCLRSSRLIKGPKRSEQVRAVGYQLGAPQLDFKDSEGNVLGLWETL